MEMSSGFVRQFQNFFLIVALGWLTSACDQKKDAPISDSNVETNTAAKWLAKREEARKSPTTPPEIAPEPVQQIPVATVPDVVIPPVNSLTNQGDFAQRLNAIVGTTLASDKEIKEKAARGDSEAQRELGRVFANNGDYATAAEWYRKSAAQGDAQAQHDLAVLYVHGLGVPQDFAEAVRLFELAAAQGDVESQYSLGLRYLKGDHVEQDFAKAAEFFTLAALQGNADAQLSLARRFIAGEGVAKDVVEGYKWSSLADKNGKWGAAEVRDNLAATMTPQQIATANDLVNSFVPIKK